MAEQDGFRGKMIEAPKTGCLLIYRWISILSLFIKVVFNYFFFLNFIVLNNILIAYYKYNIIIINNFFNIGLSIQI